MADRIIGLFVEGPTEIELYKAIIKKMHDKMPMEFKCSIKYVDMRGLGNYKNSAPWKFNRMAKENAGKTIDVFLCIDADVFELEKKPPINRKEVKQKIQKAGAHSVTYIMAKSSIEDWFLSDFEGVREFLHLPASTKCPSGSGQTALKTLFKKANKVYIKGPNTISLIKKLNIDKIIKDHCHELKPLCKAIGIDCSIVCGKP